MIKKVSFLAIIVGLMVAGCKDDEPVLSYVAGSVIDAETLSGVEGVDVVIFDANTNAPIGRSGITDVEGNYNIQLDPGSYYAKLAKQGYESFPPRSITPIAFTINAEQTTEQHYELTPLNGDNLGWITGMALEGENGVAGALMVAVSGATGYSTVSNSDGSFTIYNVPAGTMTLKAWLMGYSSEETLVTVEAGVEATVNVPMEGGATGVVSGQVRHLAAENIDVDVALIHPVTNETIPGLSGTTSTDNYELTGVSNGTYLARASYQNDNRVMDPDRIAKFGEPEVVMTGGTVTIDFDVTGSVTLTSPTNEATTTEPLVIAETAPMFTWAPYSSSSDYIIEVVDAASGQVVWGGFSGEGDLTEKNIIIPSNTTTVEYNYDGTATIAALESGRIYRWRIYASKNDNNSATGWTLISSSEDQMGLIMIQ